MYEVLDLVYTEDEGQSVFTGTYDECQKFINKQGSYTFSYEIVPVIKKSVYEEEKERQ